MQSKRIAILGATAGGIGAALYWGLPAILREGDAGLRQGYPVRQGILVWNSDFENQREGYIRDHNGIDHRIGSYGAINAWYGTCVKYSEVATRYTSILRRSMTDDEIRGFVSAYVQSGRFPVNTLSESQRGICSLMVNTFVNFGQALRILADLYTAAGIDRMYRPAEFARRNVDLSTIVYASVFNPLVTRTTGLSYTRTVRSVARPSGWKYVGWEMIQAWADAYGITLNASDTRLVAAAMNGEMQEIGQETGPVVGMSGTMGIAALIPIIAKAIVTVVMGIGIALAIHKAIEAVSLFLGTNLGYAEAQAEAYEDAVECALDPDNSDARRAECAALVTQLADDVQSYTPGWGQWVTLSLVGAVGIGGLWAWNRWGKS